ncbi:hypothetical protein KMW28_14955 [Flammeovirga yaeyamensis]|uniref:Lipocalin-like domain-containing protein n=1 Tax=Flammeovirga yaeyamensis TaxID=367791 RepID=A0AAX1N0R4_9BACT|nr:hypothetical protein [Flammeovirga yaeyamensis]MBB3700106.1 hypothetical protein [Flammeovirga yaeyamensis]NMF37263.1 hypothetical protein [Flammeovirga yaeyamensis]QWG00951.1 hypothetical protein KMW28_14955 [Flammeovirga yaeyamensis]
MKNLFLHTWELIPELSIYENGIPPKSASYTFKEGKEGKLDVSIQWIDAEDQSFTIDYTITPDGKRYDHENKAQANEVMSEFISYNQLNSYTYKGGELIVEAKRIIADNGIMKVTRRMILSEEKSFTNLQFYKKRID